MELADQTPEYQEAYKKAQDDLDAAERSTPARGSDGKFVKAEEPAPTATEAAPASDKPPEPETVDPMAEMRSKLEAAEKRIADNQAWATRNAQELAELKRERDQKAYEASRPKILDANPELEAAIKYVNPPAQRQAPASQDDSQFRQVLDRLHPDVAQMHVTNPELYQALLARRQAIGEAWDDPFTAAREISDEKVAFAQRNAEKQLAAERAKQSQKSAMSVPGQGAVRPGGNPDADAVARIKTMTDAEFDRERRRVLGY